MSHASRLWLFVFAYVLLILVLLPLTPDFWVWALDFSKGMINPAATAVNVLAAVVVGVWLTLRGFRSSVEHLVASAAGMMLLLVVPLMVFRFAEPLPAERLHLIEYAVLGFLLVRAWALSLQPRAALLAGFGVGLGIGVIDEGLQYVLPNRVGQLQDMWLNWSGVGLGILAHWLYALPRTVSTEAVDAR